MGRFLKWQIITLVYICIIFMVEFNYSFFSGMAAVDATYICYVHWGVFLLGCSWAGCKSLPSSSEPKYERVNLLCEYSTTLGLLGSVMGIAIMFQGLDLMGVDLTDKSKILDMMGSITIGLGSALTTTITGIIVSLALSLYIFTLKSYGGESKSRRVSKKKGA